MNENEIFEELSEVNFERKIKIQKEAVDCLLKALKDYIYGYKFKDYDEDYKKDAVDIFITDILKSVKAVNDSNKEIIGYPHCLNCGNPLIVTGYFQTHAKNLCYSSLFCLNCKKAFKYYSDGGKRMFELPNVDFDSRRE